MLKWDILAKFLSPLVIPLLLWGIKLEVGNAVRDTKIASLETEVSMTRDLQSAIAAQNVLLGRIGEQINATNKRLDDIKVDLRRDLPPGH